ncbi:MULTISPECIES: LytTR family DNA-binding domain-containing protein [unclassified Isoptericola]|uniref:LytR/AlgR family response regulator transcription factor n=1 Tax=unclassified Isoptericola TaxID=2623355 RepID=UPI002713A5FE|nr:MULTISPECIES: LytTR family DNA-binding domain-containing protein [unclassified Isoptericola]MDO8144420.1 LytTR family DNA-binding domain-containing protein [Isoptericola sp. 178]MDO8151755.1 LytTR family DNA-binding domain-containing protein [Isoptericola sp. b408]
MRPKALIVDDEAPARAELRYLLEEVGQVQVVGEATNGEEALLLLGSLDYDLVLLDVRMPGGSGLDVAAALRDRPRPPKVIFTTAYPDHAVDAFDLAAVDYLLKPFDADRLQRALERALRTDGGGTAEPAADRGDDSATSPPPGPRPPSGGEADTLVRIPVQRDGRTVLVDGASIVYASAARGYSYLKLADERLLVTMSLNELERRLRGHFFRAHRSYLVNLDHVRELVPDFQGSLVVVMDDRQRSRVEVSRRHARELRRRFGM